MKAITLLGLVFIPLAFTTSLFGMESPYKPGDDLFWVYFVTSIPLIVVILLAYYVLDLGYNDEGRAWSLENLAVRLDRLRRQENKLIGGFKEGRA